MSPVLQRPPVAPVALHSVPAAVPLVVQVPPVPEDAAMHVEPVAHAFVRPSRSQLAPAATVAPQAAAPADDHRVRWQAEAVTRCRAPRPRL